MLHGHQSLSLRLIALMAAQTAVLAIVLVTFAGMSAPQTTVAMAILAAALILSAWLVKRLLAPPLANAVIAPTRDVSDTGAVSHELERLSASHLQLVLGDSTPDQHREDLNEARLDEPHQAEKQADALMGVVAALDGGLRRLACGDLTVRIEAPFPEELEGLRADFNNSLDRLEETIGEMGGSSSALHGRNAELHSEMKLLMDKAASHTAMIASTAEQASALFEIIRETKTQAQDAGTVGHNAMLDVAGTAGIASTATSAMATVEETSAKIVPLTETIARLAFQANMLAMNAKIEAAHPGQSGQDLKVIAEDIRQLAEKSAGAAKEISILGRQTAEAATLGGRAIGRVCGELNAARIYVEALHERVGRISASSTRETEAMEELRSALMTLSKSGREQFTSIDGLRRNADGMTREIAAIDRHASRFTPVTVIQPFSVFKPQPHDAPRRGSHLRLVKT
jgi:methyl-accepting chemotaxis protein